MDMKMDKKNSNLSEMFSSMLKVRTPLGVTGGIIVLVYGIYKQVLNLKVFSTITSNDTVQIINSIIDKVFILAITSIVISFILYFAPKLIGLLSKSSKNVHLIDASLANDEHYEEKKHFNKDGKIISSEIKPKRK